MSPLIENVEQLIQDVPSLPTVAQKIMHLLGDPRTTNAALSEALASDQGLASRILQMANSPAYGTRQKVSSIQNAIFVLGHNTLRGLIITVCTKGLFKDPGEMESKLWEHALGAAVAARQIAEKNDCMDPDDAFVGGLLHDIGQTMLAIKYKMEYQAIFEKSSETPLAVGENLDLEKQEFGYDHCQIGARVIVKWRLPVIYSRIARRHHTTNRETLDTEEDIIPIAVGAQSNLIAHRVGLGLKEPDRSVDIINTEYNKILKLSRDDIMQIVEHTLLTYKKFKSEFAL